MSSISESLAKNIIKNNGVYVAENGERDPKCFAVFKIINQYFGHEHHVVVYTFDQFVSYAIDHEVTEILWSENTHALNAALKGMREEMADGTV